ncbi:response regulator [Gammaproteobacteria bacterium AB-CW1]|uniref:histidine kinase n=1 Tax=Natronospira elongata TaxID=3110268 RepID=A0AAP6JFJ6_9GAMM|nr:response regulator [Gammaproteobacteria bacterium AB-CW1]
MPKLRLRTQILLVALLPTLLVSLVVSGYLLGTRLADLRSYQQNTGETIARHLAPASEFAVFSGNQLILDRLTEQLVEEDGVQWVRILDINGDTLSEAGRSETDASPAGLLNRLFPVAPEALQFESSIRLGEEPVGEFEALFADDADADGNNIIGYVEVGLSTEPLMERQGELLRFGLLLILGGLMLAWGMATRAALSAIRPINRVVTALRDFSSGDLDTRVPERSQGETGMLERGFNALAEEVKLSRERMEAQIEQATSELRETLEAVEVQNVEMDLARKRAEESNRIKSEFLANISHEIRTPMNAIFGYTQLLARTELEKTQKDYIVTIQRSAESLLALLEDVLNLSRIEAGRVEVEDSPFDPEELLENVISLSAPGIFAKGLDLYFHPRTQLPAELMADAVKLRQIIGNLLSNAAKFTEAGFVRVEAAVERDKQAHWLVVDVVDSGIGIRDEDASRLFMAFSQLDTSSSRRHQGAGLGLVICEQLTRLMGGRIEVESELGQGSRFRVEIPVRVIKQNEEEHHLSDCLVELLCPEPAMGDALQARLAQWGCQVQRVTAHEASLKQGSEQPPLLAAVAQAQLQNEEARRRILAGTVNRPHSLVLAASLDRTILTELETEGQTVCQPLTMSSRSLRKSLRNNFQDLRSNPGKNPSSAEADSQPLHGLNILMVEDNRINRHLTMEFLESAGANARAAEDGYQALSIASEFKPDLVLMDIQLPGMDGLETTERLRHLAGMAAVPVLALTASASEEERRRCEQAGLEDVLVKPVREEHLVERVRHYLPETRKDTAPPPPADTSSDSLETTESSASDQPSSDRPPSDRPMGRSDSGELRPEIAAMVKADLPAQMETARDHYQNGAFDDLDAEVHRMRGTAAFCGFKALASCCEQIRLVIEQGETDNNRLARLMDNLSEAVDEVLDTLD